MCTLKGIVSYRRLASLLVLATTILAGSASSLTQSGCFPLDDVIQKGEFKSLHIGAEFDKKKVRGLFRFVELEADDLPEGQIYILLGETEPTPKIQIFRLDQRIALVVNYGKIAMVSLPFSPIDGAEYPELSTSGGLIKPGASERDVITYFKRNKIQFRVVDDEGTFVQHDKTTRVKYRNYIVDSTKVIIKVINGQLFALLLCDDEMFARIAETPQRLDVPLASERVWVEASLMAARLSFHSQPVCPPSARMHASNPPCG